MISALAAGAASMGIGASTGGLLSSLGAAGSFLSPASSLLGGVSKMFGGGGGKSETYQDYSTMITDLSGLSVNHSPLNFSEDSQWPSLVKNVLIFVGFISGLILIKKYIGKKKVKK